MASSSKCFFFVFLCLAALLTPYLAEAEDRSKLIPIGPCLEIRDCSQTCIESQFLGGKCIKWYPDSIKETCACFVKPSISHV
ncbi:PREDICTED: putative defensin-like protein 31 [Camelina sativa]|uniref:Defensin-like protein 31 n=1 Tax=Camelina sativa TaxID=90675 RepID=A0ABM1QN00_CAMSA|nr:PREDICTED: putative defensin-like protein 31 [Camelina sativa]